MADEIRDAIEENAVGPAEVTVDGATRRQHSLREQIEADRYLTPASSKPARGMRITKLIPPGTA